MGVGYIVVLIKDYTFIKTTYKKGDKFRIIGIRGRIGINTFDLESLKNGYIYDIDRINFELINKIRNKKIEEILDEGNK